MKHCPNGHEGSGETKFSPICGAEVIDNGTTYCTKCSTSIVINEKITNNLFKTN